MKSDHPNSMICPETELFKTMDGLAKSQTEKLRSLTAFNFLHLEGFCFRKLAKTLRSKNNKNSTQRNEKKNSNHMPKRGRQKKCRKLKQNKNWLKCRLMKGKNSKNRGRPNGRKLGKMKRRKRAVKKRKHIKRMKKRKRKKGKGMGFRAGRRRIKG